MEKIVSFGKKLLWLYVGILVINAISAKVPFVNSLMTDPWNAFKSQ